MKKRGISLIVLIVTIIVIIILAAAVILTLSKNNPIGSAKEASFKEDVYNFKTELELYKAKISRNGEDVTKLYASKDSDPSITDVISSMQKKYINKLEVREGKLAYVGKDKTEYLLAREINLLPEDELLDDDILTELKPFITEWTVEAGDSIVLPLSTYAHNRYNFSVNYGDGTGNKEVTSATDEDATHTYTNEGTYIVTITGECPAFSFNAIPESKDKITKIIQWGDVFYQTDGIKSALNVNFRNCVNLSDPIPEPLKNTFAKINSLEYLFSGCTSITEIPPKLFYNSNVSSYSNCFSGCINLQYIPENLFIKCNKATNFDCTFQSCSTITEIPNSLFKNCPNVMYFRNTFNGSKIEKIPSDLFKNCPNVTHFTECFLECRALKEVPENLFDNCNQIIDCYRMFARCYGVTGNAPRLWEKSTITRPHWCFTGCTNLSNYSEIPDLWK